MYTVYWTQRDCPDCEMSFPDAESAQAFLDCLREDCKPYMTNNWTV